MNRLEIATRLGAGLLAKLTYVVTSENKQLFAADALALADALIAAHNEEAEPKIEQSSPTKALSTDDLAIAIVDDLMTASDGTKADLLELYDGVYYLGGWDRNSLIARITKHLNT